MHLLTFSILLYNKSYVLAS